MLGICPILTLLAVAAPEPSGAPPAAPTAASPSSEASPPAAPSLSPAPPAVPLQEVHDAAPEPPKRLVVAPTFALNFGVYPLPATELGLFLGGLVSKARPNKWTALGVRSTLAFGPADIPINPNGLAVRLHLTVHGVAGRRGRLMYAAGVGPVLFPSHSIIVEGERRPLPIAGFDVEGRIGVVFGQRADTRIHGVFGGQLRIAAASERRSYESPIAPQLGLFVGFVRAPVKPRDAPSVATPPPPGLGLLIPGLVLLAGASVGVGLLTTAYIQGGAGDHSCRLCGLMGQILMPLGLAVGGPLTVVGAVRVHRYRQSRAQVGLGPGLSLKF